MVDVLVFLEFLSPSLGNVKQADTVFRMLRDSEGHVLFLPTWWSSPMRFASRALGLHQRLVNAIEWEPIVVGDPSSGRLFRRYVDARHYAEHEAFWPGQQIGVRARLPSRITLVDFRRLLTTAGEKRGISPYRGQFGFFKVVDVK